jgi:hypothetical protein
MMSEATVRLFLYPDFQRKQIACNVLNRIAWGLSGMNKESVTICLPEISTIKLKKLSDANLPPSQQNYLNEMPSICKAPADEPLQTGDKMLVWDVPVYQNTQKRFSEESTICIDPYYWFNHEADQIAALQHSIASPDRQAEWRDQSHAKYLVFTERWKDAENANLYLTGPSVDLSVQKKTESGTVKFICNSLVRNEELLERLQPDVLMFSDPAYHFGVSQYAAAFREYAKKAMLKFPDLICMVPERYYPLTVAFLGEVIRQRIIGIPLEETDEFNFPSADQFFVKKTANILTLLMIPVASQIAGRINIFGADGRNKGDKGYWKHSQSSQMSDQMKTIYDTHPSLGRDEDVEKYYDEHCQLLEELLTCGETAQAKQYCCKTPSFIPALASREC